MTGTKMSISWSFHIRKMKVDERARPPYLVESDGSLHSFSEQMCSSVIDGINLKRITFLKVSAFPLIPESFS